MDLASQVQNLNRKSVRRLVLEDEISDLSCEERNFNERDARKEAGDPNFKNLEYDSDSHSSFNSDASRINFWRDLYQGAGVGENQILMANSSENQNLKNMQKQIQQDKKKEM